MPWVNVILWDMLSGVKLLYAQSLNDTSFIGQYFQGYSSPEFTLNTVISVFYHACYPAEYAYNFPKEIIYFVLYVKIRIWRSWHFVTLPTIIGGGVISICWFVVYKLTFDICRHQAQLLTHWHLVIANGMIILDQHWLRSWLGAWWRQGGIFLFCIQLRTISKIFSRYQSITHMWISHTNNFIHTRQVSMS